MSKNERDCNLAVIIDGGIVKGIVTDCLERFERINFLVIDYKDEKYDEADRIPVLQGNGAVISGMAGLWPLEETAIDLEGVVQAITQKNEVDYE